LPALKYAKVDLAIKVMSRKDKQIVKLSSTLVKVVFEALLRI
jgi:hypothetical protein